MNRIVFIPCLICLAAGAALAQDAQIIGFVKDPAGAVVPHAAVTIINQGTAARRTAETNESGLYTVPLLPAGMYRMTFEAKGFKTYQQDDIKLDTAANARVDATLEVGGVEQSVTIKGDAGALINREDASVSSVADRQFLESAPLNGRTLQSLFTLVPGVEMVPPSRASNGQFSVNGQRTDNSHGDIAQQRQGADYRRLGGSQRTV